MTDLTLVTDAYSRARTAGQKDHAAFNEALSVYQELMPDVPEREARIAVGKLIADAGNNPTFSERWT